jgi:hypothetical protein
LRFAAGTPLPTVIVATASTDVMTELMAIADYIHFPVVLITWGNPKGDLFATVWWISGVGEFNCFSIRDCLGTGFFARVNREWPILVSWNSYPIIYRASTIVANLNFTVS